MVRSRKRRIEICILSDIHLGTYGCQADKVLQYLKSIEPEMLILNGDIIDIWNFKKSFFPAAHVEVLRKIFKWVEKGVKVVYITGNHDESLRKYSDLRLEHFMLTDKYIFHKDGKKYWVFHGDVFDATTKGYARIIAKLGGKGYDFLILLNRFINASLSLLGREKMSFSKKVKNSIKHAVAWINNFENTAAELGIDDGFDYVICGHIHQPVIRKIISKRGSIQYMNSGDWVENLTSLEYIDGHWSIFHFKEDAIHDYMDSDEESVSDITNDLVFNLGAFKKPQKVPF